MEWLGHRRLLGKISRPQLASFAAHGLLVWALAHTPDALYLKANPVMWGNGGEAQVMVLTTAADGRTASDALEAPLRYAPPRPQVAAKKPVVARAREAARKQAAAPASKAGSALGSAMYGALSGQDVRPAIPLQWRAPEIYPWQVPSDVRGRIIVEVTIDKSGAVIATRLLQSLGHGLDEKVIAAVQKWRYRPATVDGVPIPSKQDVVYPFPS